MNKPHPTLHVFYPGPTPVIAAQYLLTHNPELMPINLATCIQHYRWVLKPDTVPARYRGHPELALWKRHYLPLAAFGHAQAMMVAQDARIRDSIAEQEHTYFSTALAALDQVAPLRKRSAHETQPLILAMDARIDMDELAVRVLADNPGSPVVALFPLYPYPLEIVNET